MNPDERKLALRVVRRSRRVLEARRQLEQAERELKTATEALSRYYEQPVADQATALSVEGRA